ncbi:MAG: putative PEP-binding protein, partial [Coriobacteriales bacterium]
DDPRSLEVEITRLEDKGGDPDEIASKRKLLKQIDSMVESNPMLGLRGCRLGILYPELPAMQTRAIATACAQLKKEGLNPEPQIMIPLVASVEETKVLREEIQAVVDEVAEEQDVELDLPIGGMIELPRAALISDELAHYSDFYSFGTNDLTQTTFGFSRDDVESKFIPVYLDRHLLKANPFQTIDPVVADLVKDAIAAARKVNPSISAGICGEQGADPDSIRVFNKIGVTYVSVSPYGIPVARLASGQAAIEAKQGK